MGNSNMGQLGVSSDAAAEPDPGCDAFFTVLAIPQRLAAPNNNRVAAVSLAATRAAFIAGGGLCVLGTNGWGRSTLGPAGDPQPVPSPNGQDRGECCESAENCLRCLEERCVY